MNTMSREFKKGEKYRPIVRILKTKKGKPTVVEFSGYRFQLQHPDQFQRGGKKLMRKKQLSN